VAQHLQPVASIKGLQVAIRWALGYFAREIKKVSLWSMPLLEEKEKEKEKEEEKQMTCDQRLQGHALTLTAFLCRFPNLAIIQADAEDKELGFVLKETFKNHVFPTVEHFVDIVYEETSFNGRVPFPILARALPNLRMVGVEFGSNFVGSKQLETESFLREFAQGMFPQVQEIYLSFAHVVKHQNVQELFFITDMLHNTCCDFISALKAREGFPFVGTKALPALTKLMVYAQPIRTSAI
jgi:hypothetical protein